jgi:hypothetical protein
MLWFYPISEIPENIYESPEDAFDSTLVFYLNYFNFLTTYDILLTLYKHTFPFQEI